MRPHITDTQEYKLAPHDKRAWAFTHRDNYKSSEEAAAAVGIKTKGRKIKVQTNTGDEHEIEVDIHYYAIKPTAAYKKVWANVGGRSHEYVYMIKGGNPKGKTAIWFTEKMMQDSPGFIAPKKEITDAWDKYKDEQHEMLKKELAKSHAPVAKKAIEELPAIAEKDGAAGVHEWFRKNKFDIDHLKDEDFEDLVKSLKKNGHVISDWTIASRPDGFGHQEGTNAMIDWHGKRIGRYGWSSSD